MEIIPVIDLKNDLVVRARMGQRDQYRPIETPLSPSSDPVDVVRGLLGVSAFRTLYVADLDAIERRGDARMALARVKSAFPHLDVKIVGSSHGGCVRLVGVKEAGVTDLQQLKGKTIGVSDIASPGKNFFSILLKKNGIDADRDVTWRQYPADLLDIAVNKGEIQAIADGDPTLYLIEKRNKGRYQELASNLSGEYKDKVCCIVGARGELVRQEKPVVAAQSRSLR